MILNTIITFTHKRRDLQTDHSVWQKVLNAIEMASPEVKQRVDIWRNSCQNVVASINIFLSNAFNSECTL